MATKLDGNGKEVTDVTVQRQCEWEYLDEIAEQVGEVDVVLSLGCGIGVQAMAEHFPNAWVVPGLNTSFLGLPTEQGVWAERCAACGDCILGLTGGICPIARCSKSLLNGPCGGSEDGHCEINADVPCAWQLIYDRLSSMGKLDRAAGDPAAQELAHVTRRRPAQDRSGRSAADPRRRNDHDRTTEQQRLSGRARTWNECSRPATSPSPAELGPPQNADGEVIRKKAKLLKGNCDAVNLTDNQTAIVRMSSIGAGTIVVQEGLEPVIQMTCRDRNRLAMQSDLLGAYALGMRNLLCLSGDHQTFGNHPTAKNVFDMDSIQLVQMVAAMRDQRRFPVRRRIQRPGTALLRRRGRIALCRSDRVSPVPAGQESQGGREFHPDAA